MFATTNQPCSLVQADHDHLIQIEERTNGLEDRLEKTEAAIERIDGRMLTALLLLVAILASTAGPSAVGLVEKLAH